MKKQEKITVPFADRCKEYQDAGYALKPSCIQTNRYYFGSFWVTIHLYFITGKEYALYLN